LMDRGRAAEAKVIREKATAEATAILERSIAAGREAVRLRPDDAMAHFRLGRILGDQGKSGETEAIAAYREAIRLKPDLEEAYHKLSTALENQNKLDEAIAVLRDLIKLHPDKPDDLIDLSKLLKKLNLAKEAGDASEAALVAAHEAVRLHPHTAWAHADLANALLAKSGFEKIDAETIAELLTAKRIE